jgi:hypothetical protein
MRIRTVLVSFVWQVCLLLVVTGCGGVGGADLVKDAAAQGAGGATGGSGARATVGTGGMAGGGLGGIRTGGVGGITTVGSDSGGTVGRRDASAGGAGVDGRGSSSGGIGGGLSSGGVVGTGGIVNSPCPSTAPSDGSSCDYVRTDSCVYEDCAGNGRTLAVCESGSWQVTTVPCTPATCDQTPCALGQVCLYLHRGYVTRDCVTTTCGTGLVTPECVPGSIGGCSVTATPTYPTSISCSYCSGAGGCQ